MPPSHRRCWRSDLASFWVNHGIVVVNGPNDVHSVIVGVLDVPAGVVTYGLVVKSGNERSRAKHGLIREAEIESRHGSLGGGEGLELSVGQPDGVVGEAGDGAVTFVISLCIKGVYSYF